MIRSVTSTIEKTALRVAGGFTGTSSAPTAASSQSTSNSALSSSKTGMTRQEKIGISLGVIFGVALFALGAHIWWYRRRRRTQKEIEVLEEKQRPPLEVDAKDSALTREQYDKRVAVELNGVITSQELESRQSPVELDARQNENSRDAR